MSVADLGKMEAQIARLKTDKHDAERKALRNKVVAMIKAHGFEMNDLFGRSGPRARGHQVSRPRSEHLDRPRPYAPLDGSRHQGGKAKREDFLI